MTAIYTPTRIEELRSNFANAQFARWNSTTRRFEGAVVDLSGYVPYSGASSSVVLGANSLSTTVGLITPKIYPAADSTTAVQVTKADGSTAVMTVDTTNSRVGIGCTPSYPFHVRNSAQQPALIEGTHGTWAGFTFNAASATGKPYFELDRNGTARALFYVNTDESINIATDGIGTNNRLTILSTGLVGINQTSPTAQLHVATKNATTVGHLIKLYTAQSANAFEVQPAGSTTPVMSVDCEGEMTINGSLAPSLRIIGTDRNNTETYRSRVFLKADSLGYAAGVHFMSGGTGNWWIGTAYSGYGPYQFSINYYAGAENQAVAHQNTAKQLLAWTTSGQMGVYLPAPATPTARLHLPAGTATASTAPLKFTVGVNLTTPESGAVEYDGSNFYITTSTPTRLAIATLPVAEVDNGNSGTAKTITWANGSHQKVTLTGNCTFTFTAPSTVRTVTLKVISGGAYTATWPGSVIWSGDPPVLSQVAGTYDLISLYWDGSNYIGATSTPKITTYTDTGSIAELDELVIANKATPFTLTLPAAISGSFKKIKNIGAGTVTLDGASTDTLDDELTQDVAQWECMSLACYTTGKWAIV